MSHWVRRKSDASGVRPARWQVSFNARERGGNCEGRTVTKALFDAQDLVVFGKALTRGGAPHLIGPALVATVRSARVLS